MFDLSIYDKIDYNHKNNVYSFTIISSKTKEERNFVTKTKREQENWVFAIKLNQDILHKQLPKIWKCDICKTKNKINQIYCSKCKKQNVIIKIISYKIDPFSLCLVYSPQISIKYLLNT